MLADTGRRFSTSLAERDVGSTKRRVDRVELHRRLQQIVASARELGSVHAVAVIEIEPIVDASANAVQHLATLLRQRIRQSDTLAELDTHRYGLILQHCPLEKATGVARKLLDVLHSINSLMMDGIEGATYRAVVGVVPFSAEAKDANALIDSGCQACQDAWALGGNRVHVFRSDANGRAHHQREILRAVELVQAIEHNQLQLFGQEIVPLSQDLPRYVEVLLRLPDGDGGTVHPGAFVLAAERYDLATRLDGWVVSNVLAGYRRWFGDTPVGVSINLSAKSVGDEELLELVPQCLAKYNVPAERVCFEITETAALNDVERARRFIAALRQLGCSFALDDFGSGHASFRYLKVLDLDYLKIDGSFVRGVLDQEFDSVMVESIHRIGRVLGIRVVAEGVESHEVLERLRDVGLDYAQGWVHGRPCPIEELARSAMSRS